MLSEYVCPNSIRSFSTNENVWIVCFYPSAKLHLFVWFSCVVVSWLHILDWKPSRTWLLLLAKRQLWTTSMRLHAKSVGNAFRQRIPRHRIPREATNNSNSQTTMNSSQLGRAAEQISLCFLIRSGQNSRTSSVAESSTTTPATVINNEGFSNYGEIVQHLQTGSSADEQKETPDCFPLLTRSLWRFSPFCLFSLVR